jgi:hypothetical protein
MRFWVRNSAALTSTVCLAFAATTMLSAQTSKPATKKAGAHRMNELTLAGLRPGRDTRGKAIQLYRKPIASTDSQNTQLSWASGCNLQTLTMDVDTDGKIQVIRATAADTKGAMLDCKSVQPTSWRTGNGLRIGDAASKVAELYGQPDSRSPSTKDGQPLELWYYAFDWAGADVPQVMEVLCTVEKNGSPGRVVEITLAAPSL